MLSSTQSNSKDLPALSMPETVVGKGSETRGFARRSNTLISFPASGLDRPLPSAQVSKNPGRFTARSLCAGVAARAYRSRGCGASGQAAILHGSFLPMYGRNLLEKGNAAYSEG